MSKRNVTINRIYQETRGFGFLNARQRKSLREAIENAYDAGRAHGIADTTLTLGQALYGREDAS